MLVAREVRCRQTRGRSTILSPIAAPSRVGCIGRVRQEPVILMQPAGRDAGHKAQKLPDVSSACKIQVVCLVVRIQIHSPRQWGVARLGVKSKRIIPSERVYVVLEKRTDILSLNTPGTLPIVGAYADEIIKVVNRLG